MNYKEKVTVPISSYIHIGVCLVMTCVFMSMYYCVYYPACVKISPQMNIAVKFSSLRRGVFDNGARL